MIRFVIAGALLLAANSASAKPPVQPPEPSQHPNWSDVATKGRDQLISSLFDPGSAQVAWTSGFQWGFLKPLIGKRKFGWIACGTLNAKNRMGGYVGAEGFLVFVESNGTITSALQSQWISTCDSGPFVSPMAELRNFDATKPNETPQIGIAAELEKLAELRDKGIISQAEFETQKAKLLAR